MSGAGSSPGWLKLRIAMLQTTFLLCFQNKGLGGSKLSWRKVRTMLAAYGLAIMTISRPVAPLLKRLIQILRTARLGDRNNKRLLRRSGWCQNAPACCAPHRECIRVKAQMNSIFSCDRGTWLAAPAN